MARSMLEWLGIVKVEYRTMTLPDNERAALEMLMRQYETDLKSAHAEICKAQDIDPADHDWPGWTPQANTLRWIDAMRQKFGFEPKRR